MNKILTKICFSFTLLFLTSCGEVTIEAEPGMFEVLEYDLVKGETEYSIKMTMLEAGSDGPWASTLAFGMADIVSKDKLEIYLGEHDSAPNGLVAGYRYVVNGKVVYNTLLVKNVHLGETIYWNLSWTPDKRFKIELVGQSKASIETDLSNLLGYVKVSGAKGKILRD